jgi:DNA polymerase-3 subunit alpha
LFGTAAAPAPAPFALREVALWSEEERLASEYAMLGFYVSGHPLAKYASLLAELKTISLGEVESRRNREEITVPGLIVGVRPMRSKRGARWAIYTIQDMTGVQELLVFPESFTKLENVLKSGVPLLMKARVQIEEAGTRLSLLEARRLDEIAGRSAVSEFRLRLDVGSLTEDMLDHLENLLGSSPGASPVIFELRSPDGSVAQVQAQQKVKVSPELASEIRKICGEQAVDAVSE